MTLETDIDLGDLVGSTLADKYRLTDVLGAGAMGYVYQAEQIGLGRTVAVKLLKPELVADHLELFRTEALAASRINHPHAIAIYDFGVTQVGMPYLVMEHLRGTALADVIGGRPMPASRAVTIGAQVLSALSEAHACGVIHRDLKSDNIVLEPLRDGDDFAKLIDFGIARLAGGTDHISGIAGTPECMAPEQIRGEEPTAATDLYAVGILLYEMIAGQPPFSADSVMAVLNAHLSSPPVPPARVAPSCPPALSDLIMQALEKDPGARPASARAMRDALLHAAQNAEARRSCPACGGLVAPSQRFCGECGEAIESTSVRLDPIALPTALLDDDDDHPTQHFIKLRSSRVTRISIEMATAGRTFVGRAAERARLAAFYREPGAAAMAVVGPVGIGRSRLVGHVADELGAQVATFVAAADPAGIAQPWFPVATMLQSALGLPPAPSAADVTAASARVRLGRRDQAGLLELFGCDSAIAVLEPEVRRREVEASTIRCLSAVGDRYPRAVLCFLDVDAYDAPSRALVDKLVATLDGSGVRVVVTASDAAAVPAGVDTIRLEPLSPADSRALAGTLAPAGRSLPDAAAIHALTGGVPERIVQLVGWLCDGNSAGSAAVPLADVIAGRVAGLLPAARRVLQAVAVHGSVAGRALVRATVGAFGRAHEEALVQLVEQRLLAADPEELRLPSELVRDVVRSATPQDVLRELHRNALAALRGETASVFERAAHQAGARDGLSSIDGCEQAGADSLRRFDPPGAVRWYARAVDIAWECQSAGVDGAQRALMGASIRLSDALRVAGQLDLSTDVLTQAALGEPDKAQRAFISRQRARLAATSGRYDAAVRHYRSAIKQAIAAGDRGEFLCEAYVEMSAAVAESNPAAAIDTLREAVQVASFAEGFECDVDNPWLWRLGVQLVARYWEAGDTTMAEHIAASALAYARRRKDALGEARLLELTAALAEEAGKRDDAVRDRVRAIELLKALGDRLALSEVLRRHAPHSSNPASAERAARQLADELAGV